jgi:hypothetical protein
MTAPASPNATDPEPQEPCAPLPAGAIVVLAAGLSAVWLAAGSTGLLGHPLQHALTWLALLVAIVAAWPENMRRFGTWAILAIGAGCAVAFTASTIPTVNVLGVAVALAAIAQTTRSLTRRVALIAALAAMVLGCFRFAYASIPIVWLTADGFGWLLGRAAGTLASHRLEVGATFGGMDFLVVSAAVYVGWVVCTVPPRRRRALWAAGAIVFGHFVYLAALAHSEKLFALLPAAVVTPITDTSHLGHWTWGGGLRTLAPWNMPLLAMLIHGAIIVVMVRTAPWLPVIEIDPELLRRQREWQEKEEIPGSVLMRDMLFHFGPPLLAVAAALLATLAPSPSDLKGKKIVAYEGKKDYWLKPQYDSADDGLYGMLPALVESLGGKFVRSKDFSANDLDKADVLVVIHPDARWPQDVLDRVWGHVRGGGSLLVAAEPAVCEGTSSSSFNELLQPTSMQVRFDTAVMRASQWEQSYEITSHPAAVGIDDLRNRFGVRLGSSIRVVWPARPALVGRWGWSDPGNDAAATGGGEYNAGEPLGDLVLAAEGPLGRGRVFVLGDTSPLQNNVLPVSYPFVGRLLSHLACRPSSPQTPWRQVAALAALAAMLALLAGRPAAWQTMLTPAVMAVALLVCVAVDQWSGRVLPDGRALGSGGNGIRGIAYIDASHLEAFDDDSIVNRGVNHGIVHLARALMRDGYLPLLAPDVTPERLERCELLISIGPGREFSPSQRAAVREFVGNGGTFLCMAGAEDSRAVGPLLAEFGLRVPPSPVPPGSSDREPATLGAMYARTAPGNLPIWLYAAWPVEALSDKDGVEQMAYWTTQGVEYHIILRRAEGGGSAVVIGDTHCGGNQNVEMDQAAAIRFWRWLLSRLGSGRKPWNPPAGEAGSSATEDEG